MVLSGVSVFVREGTSKTLCVRAGYELDTFLYFVANLLTL